MCLENPDRPGRVGETTREGHSRRPMVAICEAQRRNADLRKRVARRDDVRLGGVAPEAVQDRGAAKRCPFGKVEDAVELAILDFDREALRRH